MLVPIIQDMDVMVAIYYPGSSQMKVLKEIMFEIQLVRFRTNARNIFHLKNTGKVVITGSTPEYIISYLPSNLNTDVNYFLPKDRVAKWAKFIKPKYRRRDTYR